MYHDSCETLILTTHSVATIGNPNCKILGIKVFYRKYDLENTVFQQRANLPIPYSQTDGRS
jgi:hypothetical protein